MQQETTSSTTLSSIFSLLYQELINLPSRRSHQPVKLSSFANSLFSVFQDSSIQHSFQNNNDIVNINATLNSTLPFNISTVCHPILFQPGLSREVNGTYEFGLCPDTYSSFTLCLILVVAYVVTVVLSGIGIFWKRKSGHVKARDPLYLGMTCVANFVFVVGLTMRIVVGRKLFPCGLLTVCFFILPPAMMLPTVFRLMRLYLMYRINLKKMKLFETPTPQGTMTVKEIDPATTQNIQPTSNGESMNYSLNTTTTTMFGQEDISHRQEHVSSVMHADLVPPSHNQQPQTMVEFQQLDEDASTDNDSETMADVSTWRLSEVKDFSEVKKEIRKLTIMNFFVSYKFLLLVYAIAFVVGVAIWLILGTIEEVIYNASTDPNKKRLFLLEGGMLVFDRGCGFTTTTILIVGLEALFYIVIEIAFLILSFFADRDTWSIKKEALILIVFQFIGAVIFIVVGMFNITEILLDYLVPTGLALWVYNYLEVWVCVTLPVLYAIRSDASQKDSTIAENHDMQAPLSIHGTHDVELPPVTTVQDTSRESGLEKILKNKKTFEIMLDFARRSFAPESVQCWRDIQRFKKTKRSNRKKAAMHILNAYLTLGAPLELNMSRIEEKKQELLIILQNESKTNPISHHLFDSVQDHCLNDMADLFERLKNANHEIYELVQESSGGSLKNRKSNRRATVSVVVAVANSPTIVANVEVANDQTTTSTTFTNNE
ncbi:hypothetical protein C9374_011233 [Naegleria lovaniensis]|uniref:RGS domain-containing protein n=1 Tax=Naegleria lovaniensis TaxID=51637 RepID=A0AA88GWW1_NAELO|nr:uncharacterized protein C9374_011233 [Naegleria lovaniensis]KAG2392508.1 hypothetical protein C9374_011233 [Naegleria lovaniensis]